MSKTTHASSWISLGLAAVIGCQSVAPAWAKSDTEQVADEMADQAVKAAIHKLGEEAVKTIINQATQSSATAAANSGKNAADDSVGGEVVAGVGVALSAKELLDAKNDHDRLYGALDTVAAGVAMANPFAGAILMVAILITRLIEMAMSVGHNRKMLEIAADIQKHLAAILVIERQQAKSDALIFLKWSDDLKTEMDKISELQKSIEADCTHVTEQTNLATLDRCRGLTNQVFPHVQTWIALSRQFLNFQSQYIDTSEALRLAKVDESAFRKDIDNVQANLEENQRRVSELYADLAHRSAKILVDRAIAAGNFDAVTQARGQCFDMVLHFDRVANLALVRHSMHPTIESRRALAQIYVDHANSFDEACTEFMSDRADPLYTLLVGRQQTMKAMSRALAVR